MELYSMNDYLVQCLSEGPNSYDEVHDSGSGVKSHSKEASGMEDLFHERLFGAVLIQSLVLYPLQRGQ